jgi:UDP-GlcNAc:undecaprenyl-phosphate GlcNAc-1-phosphate transferase
VGSSNWADTLLWTGGKALLFSLILTPVCRDLFRSYRVVDEPGEARKLHKLPVPRIGGISVALSYVLAFVVSRNPTEILRAENTLIWRILPAVTVVFVVGLVDDLLGLKPWQKLLGQLVAALLAFFAGVRVLGGVGYTWGMLWSLPLTLLWLMLCSNAFNLVDGMDGLAAGVGLFATLTIFVSALLEGNQPLALATLPLAACLLGFLCFNFNPATVFLGDSGSLLIGFLLGCYGAIWTQKSATFLGMAAPMMVLAIPLLDVSLSVVRRLLRNRPVFGADRGHIHHRLLDLGLHPRQAVLLIYAGCALAAGFSLLQRLVHAPQFSILLLVLFGFALWVGVRYLNYAEFSVARQLLLGGEFQQTLNARLSLRVFEAALAGAATVEASWEAIQRAARDLGFRSVRLRLLGLEREACLREEAAEAGWSARLPLGGEDFLELTHGIQASVSPCLIPQFLGTLHRTLAEKRDAGTAVRS